MQGYSNTSISTIKTSNAVQILDQVSVSTQVNAPIQYIISLFDENSASYTPECNLTDILLHK